MLIYAVESTTLATVAYDEALELLQLEFRSRAIYQARETPFVGPSWPAGWLMRRCASEHVVKLV